MPATPSRYLCTCSTCRTHVRTDLHGNHVHGCYVSSSTRSEHRRRDIEEAMKAQQSESEAEAEEDPPDPSSSPPPPTTNFDLSYTFDPILKALHMIMAWLSLCAGASRATCNIILRAFDFIINLVLVILLDSLRLHGVHITPITIHIPRDIRTVFKNSEYLDIEIIRTICCPTCFTPYEIPQVVPDRCTWKASPRSKPCNEPLWKDRQSPAKGPKKVPRSWFNMQSFKAWLKWFLSRPEIEEYLRKSFQKSQAAPTSPNIMRDFDDSPIWKSFRDYFQTPYHLMFGVYIDWFNPYTNKIAGKVVSCGAIVLYCMNLPLEVRFAPENVFIAGMTPIPKVPNAVTLSHIMHFIVKMIAMFGPDGPDIPTYSYPNGTHVETRIVPTFGDLPAIRKLTGFLEHSANYFCWFCLCTLAEKDRLDFGEWLYRDDDTVREQAQAWKAEPTVTKKAAMATATGVRWTPLHDLPYWKPVQHVVLGFMHNWLEGVLKNQLRGYWGFDRTTQEQRALEKKIQTKEEDEDVDMDQEEEDDDDDGNLTESSVAPTEVEFESQSSTGLTEIFDQQTTLVEGSDDEDTPTPRNMTFAMMPDDDDDDDDDDDYLDLPPGAFSFSEDQKTLVRQCIAEMTLPTWVDRLPVNFGEKTHGKLKAHEYLTLFTVVLPLVIPELWSEGDQYEVALLDNFTHLIASTNIVASFSTSNLAADTFTNRYVQYRKTSKILFPYIPSKPNHHYAMHTGPLLKNWGPLTLLSEFPGERLNGTLQKVKTSQREADMDLTMLRHVCQQGRLKVQVLSQKSPENSLSALADTLYPSKSSGPIELSDHEASKFLQDKNAVILLIDVYYSKLLTYLQSLPGQDQWCSYRLAAQATDYTWVLPKYVKQVHHIEVDEKNFSHSHSHIGNSAIQFCDPQNDQLRYCGFINKIWQLPLHNVVKTFLLVHPYQQLSPADTQRSPYTSRPELCTELVYTAPSELFAIIEPSHVITHLTTWVRPPGTYGIQQEVQAVCWALNRG
ncbi:hypothetical protein BDZ89DRAFT_982584, partial [Hymenopellis radicata]